MGKRPRSPNKTQKGNSVNYSTYSGKFARTMAEINPYMSGPVQPMHGPESIRSVLLAAVIGLVLAGVLVAWAMQ